MKRSVLLLAVLSITLFAGCRTVAVIPVGTHTTVSSSHHAHPPLHPSHGYRHHHHDHELVYDSDFGAYLVLGYDDVYYYNNLYFRFYSGAWQSSIRLGGTWRHAEHRHLPGKLRGHKRYKRHHRHSPPPHAPAHGHRHSHIDGVDLVFDSSIGVYVALGFDDLFFFDNHYMRYYDGYWHHANRYDGGWLRAKDKHVPHKLRKARKKHKKDFFKRVRHQYRHDHRKYRENREYRRKHKDRWNRNDRKYKGDRKHDKGRRHDDGHRNNGKYDKKRKDKYEDRGDRKKHKEKNRRNDDDDYNKSKSRDRDRDGDSNKQDGGWLR